MHCRVLDQDPFRHPRFSKLAPFFVLAQVDTRNGQAPEIRPLQVERNQSWVILYGPFGTELARVKNPKRFHDFVHLMERAHLEVQRSGAPLLDYAATFGPVEPAVRTRIERLAADLGAPHAARRADAAQALLGLGDPAYRVLGTMDAADPEVRRNIRAIRDKLHARRAAVLQAELQVDVAALWRAGGAARARVRRMLPKDAPADDPLAWWTRHAAEHRWIPGSDRFVRWDAWEGRPLRFRERDHVMIVGSEDLLDPRAGFTVEMWVRWPDGAGRVQYLCGDEMWPGMHPRLATGTKAGWVLRRYVNNGAPRLEANFGTAPDQWFYTMSEPVASTGGWEHVALAVAPDRIRIFWQGVVVAERAARGIRFHRAPTPLYLGVRQYGWNDRAAAQDVRAFRITKGARYADDFDPPQRLDRDERTLVLLDFGGEDAGSVLADRAGHGHRGVARGPRWIEPLDARAIAAGLTALGIPGGAVERFEAEDAVFLGGWRAEDHDLFSEGRGATIGTSDDPDPRGHTLVLPFRVPRAGRYRLFFAGDGLHQVPAGVSPFAWVVDRNEVRIADRPQPALLGIEGLPQALSPLGVLSLEKGEHRLRIRLTGRRGRTPKLYALWFDALLVQHLG